MPYACIAAAVLVGVTGCVRADRGPQEGAGSPHVAAYVPMNTARAAHTATTLADGRVLIAGGCTRARCDGITASAEVYDPAAAAFAIAAAMSIGRVSHTATLLGDGTVFVTGGWTDRGTTATSELFNPRQGRFAARASMRDARAAHRAVAIGDDRVLVLGGEVDTGSALASAEIYDASTDRFQAVGEMVHPRTNHSATRLRDGRILVVGGRQSRSSVTATAEIFDPVRGTFEATGSMAVPREKHEAVLLRDGRVLVVGGADSEEARHATTEIYDPEKGQFTAGPPMQSRRYKLAESIVVTAAGHVVVTGGAPEVEWLRADGNSFEVAGDMDGLREFTSAVVLPDGTILVTGGYDERIRPSANTWTVTLPANPQPQPSSDAVSQLSEGEDHGLGILGIAGSGPGTLRMRAHPDSSAEVIAELRRPGDGPYELMADGLEPILIEYGYEVFGPPFDSVVGRWARVMYGKTSDETVARGWVDLDDGTVEQIWWRDLLLRLSVSFPPGVASELFSSPGGQRLDFREVTAQSGGYDLVPVRAEGAWLLARLRAPSVCSGEALVLDTAVWIRFLDERGRPLMRGLTRGC